MAGVLITLFHTSIARHPAGYSLPPVSCTTGSDRPLPPPSRTSSCTASCGNGITRRRWILYGWSRVLCACSCLPSFFSSCFHPHPHCFPSERIADAFPLLIILAYFYRCGDSKIMCQLLGSTNKAEVLENMESFRIAWEYHAFQRRNVLI